MYGRKKVFTYGIVAYTISSLLSATSSSAVMLIAFRVLQGIGGSMVFATGVAILTSVFPAQERGKALGIYVAAVYVGLSLGPFLGGLLTEHFGWRSIFIANLPLGLVIIAGIIWKLKGEWADAIGERFDLRGSLVYGFAIMALIYGFSALPDALGAGMLVGGVVGILAFIWWETRVAHPLLDMSLFKANRVFAFSSLAALINYSATFAVAFLLSLYLQYTKGFSPQAAGTVLVATPAIQAVLSPIAGRLSDKVAPRLLASGGMALATAGLILLTLVGQGTAIWFIVSSLIILGLGFAFFSSPNTNAIMGAVDRKNYGVASATVATMRQVGMMMSMGITMLVFAVRIGRVEITPEHYSDFLESMTIAFLIFSVLCFGGIFASLARGKSGMPETQ
jgi:EmrB/QacA subfamily drug resistance transporter